MSKKQKISTELAPRQTFRSTIDRVEFDHAVPVRRPDLDPKRDLPQPTYRPGALDYMNIPSRGFA